MSPAIAIDAGRRILHARDRRPRRARSHPPRAPGSPAIRRARIRDRRLARPLPTSRKRAINSSILNAARDGNPPRAPCDRTCRAVRRAPSDICRQPLDFSPRARGAGILLLPNLASSKFSRLLDGPSLNLDDLNPEQRDAVLAPDGPILILAGAGSGKTRVLTYRIAHMLAERKAAPARSWR